MLRNENLNGELRQIIKDQHWTITDLADRLGIFDTALHRILRQNHVSDNLIKLCDALGYDVEVKLIRKRAKYTKPGVPEGLEDLSRKQAEDLIAKLQAYLETKK